MNTLIPSTATRGNSTHLAVRSSHHYSETLEKILLICGVIASLFYVAINIITPLFYNGYNIASQTVSELSAIGTPTRVLWVSMMIIYSLLMMAFAVGLLLSARQVKRLKIVGVLKLVNIIVGLFWPPMHQREVLAAGGATLTDTLHIAWTIITVPLMLLIIAFGSVAIGKRFRIFSFVTIVVLMLFGMLTSMDAPAIQANQSTPWIGIWERICIGAYMVWITVFAVAILRTKTQVSST
jgi:hypothetical protein